MEIASVGPAPKYRRAWTRVRNQRTERSSRQLLRKYDLAHVPVMLVKQFAQVAVRANQLDRQIAEIEKHVHSSVLSMSAETFQRWAYLMSKFRRYADEVESEWAKPLPWSKGRGGATG